MQFLILVCVDRDDCDVDDCEDDDDDAEVDRLCLNDNDDLIQPYFRKPSGYGVATGQMGIEAADFNDMHHTKYVIYYNLILSHFSLNTFCPILTY